MFSNDKRLQEIIGELLTMCEADQKGRKSGVWDGSLDVKHTEQMKHIIEEIGWPSISKVGASASHQAWLLVQHADHDRAFQHACLALMKALSAEDVQARDIAYLEDRVRVGDGQPQLYGTQFRTTEQGELEPFPIENKDQVDQRRANVGLGTLAEYVALLASRHKPT